MSNPTVADVLESIECSLQTVITSGQSLADIRACYVAHSPETLVLSDIGYPCLGVVFSGADVTSHYAGQSLYRWTARVTVWVMARVLDMRQRQMVLKATEWEQSVRAALDGISVLPGMDEIRFLTTGEPRPFQAGSSGEILVIGTPVTFECILFNGLV